MVQVVVPQWCQRCWLARANKMKCKAYASCMSQCLIKGCYDYGLLDSRMYDKLGGQVMQTSQLLL